VAFLLSDVSNALHNILLPYVRDNFPKQTILLDQMKRNAGVTFMNNKFYAPLRSSRHGGVTNLANDGNATVSGTAGLSQANVSVKIMTGAFDISKLAIDATKSNQSAVTNALTFQAEALASDFARSANRQLWGDGVGAMAEVAGSASSTTMTIMPLDANGVAADTRLQDRYGTVNGDIGVYKYLTAGNLIAVGSAGTAVGTISSFSPSDGKNSANSTAGTLTATGAIASAANSPIYFVDGSFGGAGSMEITGIKAALSSSSGTSQYAGVARSTTGWTPQFGSVSEALTLSRMEQSYLAAKEYAQMGDQYAIFMNKTLYKKYGDLLTSMRRTVNETDLLGGWTGLEFAAGAGKVGVFLDYDVPDGEFVVLNMDSWTICQVSDLGWLEDPNGGSLLRLSNKIQYQAEMAWFFELLCLAPAANGHETQKTS
jgi:hypothetical protein